MEEMKEQPVSPLDVDSMKAERSPLCVTEKDFVIMEILGILICLTPCKLRTLRFSFLRLR